MARSFIDHTEFPRVAPVASNAVLETARIMGEGYGLLIGPNQVDDVAAGKVVDALTRFLLSEFDRAKALRTSGRLVLKWEFDCGDLVSETCPVGIYRITYDSRGPSPVYKVHFAGNLIGEAADVGMAQAVALAHFNS